MKYTIHTSSNKKPPIEGAIKTKMHFWRLVGKDCDKKYLEKFWRNLTDYSEHYYKAVYIDPIDVWIVEIEDLHEFVKQCDESIILSEPQYEECNYYDIEIYDTFRE